jgi:hypothetical protein
MKAEVKKRLVKRISERLSINKLDNLVTDNGDIQILSIRQTDIPKDGIVSEHMGNIVNTCNFICMKIGQFNIIFEFDVKDDIEIVD